MSERLPDSSGGVTDEPRADERSVSEHSAELAAELRILIGQLRRRLRDEARPGEFSLTQRSVLSQLEREGPATISALARTEGVRPQSMNATVTSLEAAGLVQGAADPEDGRQTLWSLTAVSRGLILASRAAREDWLARAIRSTLSAGEQRILAQSAELLKRLLKA